MSESTTVATGAKRTIWAVFEETCQRHAERPAMRSKRSGSWQATSYAEYREQVRKAARGFMKLGLEPGKGVSIIGYNCPQWFVADLAAIAAGGIPAGIYTTSSPEQCQYITDHCDAVVAVVEDAEQLAKFKEVRDQLPQLKALVLMNGSDPAEDVHTWDELLALGADVPEADLDARMAAQAPDDTCTLIYTSGTTGQPKGVMITHHNIVATGEALLDRIGLTATDSVISYLPLSHIAEQVVSLHGPLARGACTWFAESIEKLGDNLREVRPNLFLAVPRVWEKIQAKMQEKGAQSSWLKRQIAKWAKKQGLAGGYADQEQRPRPIFYALANKLVFSKVREALGLDRCRMAVTSAAPISLDTLEFFLSLGIPIYEVYGMSECTGPASISLPGRYKTGKAGFALPGTEMKIAEDGELCLRGFHVCKGYLKNPEATAETIDADGWLHTGDIGVIDADGFLKITDRKKEILITAGGENVAPQPIEGQLKAIPVVSQAVVIGDRRKFLAALLALDVAKLPAEAKAAGSPATTPQEADACPKFRAHLQKQIEQVNETLARVQTIKKFSILPHELSVEGGELTPTMKTKRRVVNEKYADVIEAFYA